MTQKWPSQFHTQNSNKYETAHSCQYNLKYIGVEDQREYIGYKENLIDKGEICLERNESFLNMNNL